MRRRGLLLALPLGALTLAACDPGSPEAPADGSASRPDVPVDPAPTVIGERAEAVDPTTLRLPLEMTVMIVVDPGWTAAPQELEGVFLGYDDSGDRLRFTALDQDGTALWRAERPLSCTGFALSRDHEGRTVAVLTDRPRAEDGEFAEGTGTGAPARTVTGYDLRTAETLWGPIAVPGPQAAPGLVHAVRDDDAEDSSEALRRALSAGTGEVLVEESDPTDGRILAEHTGTVLQLEGTELVAREGPELDERWRLALPEGISPAAARITGRVDPSTGLAVLRGDEGSGVLLDIAAGRLIADDVSAAAYDHGLDVTVLAHGRTVRGLDEDGQEAWRHEDPEELVFLTAGERLAYAQRPEEGALVVLDTSQGLMVQPYDADLSGPLAVPELFSADAATSVHVEQTRYLVTTTLDEEYGMRE